jgi:hypothetical protein
VSAEALFRVELANPNSLGRRHNAELDLILSAARNKRVELGRRLQKADICSVFANWANHARSVGVRVPEKLRARNGFECLTPKQTVGLAGSPPRPAADPVSDFVDSVFALEEWNPENFEGLPTIAEDSALATELIANVEQAMDSAATYAETLESILEVVQAFGTVSEDSATFIADVSAYAYSSAEYWTENIDEWIETFCGEEEPPQDRVGSTAGLEYDGPICIAEEQSSSGSANGMTALGDDPPDCAQYLPEQQDLFEACMLDIGTRGVIKADLEIFKSIPSDILLLIGVIKESWPELGKIWGDFSRGAEGATFRQAVRASAATFSSIGAVVKAAGRVARSTWGGLALGALVADSGIDFVSRVSEPQ